MTRKLFSGNVSIFYGQFYIDALEVDDDDYLDMESAFEHQNNGLCGASHAGKLFFLAGPQDGTARISVELHDVEPIPNKDCQDIVECGFTASIHDLHLCAWANEETYALELPSGNYIVRYSIKNLESRYQENDDWEQPIKGQEYIIQFWPGSLASDRVIRSETETGQYWHRELGAA